MRKIAIKLLAAATILGASTIFFSCTNDLEVIKSLTFGENQPTQTGKDITSIYTEGGKLKVKMTTPEMQRFENSEELKTIFPKGLEIAFYDVNGKQTSSLKCKYAIYYEAKKLWEARNNVVGKNEKGDMLYTERLFWNEGEKKIYSNNYTKIVTADGNVSQGKRFESDEQFENYSISSFSGNFNMKDE